VGAVTADEAPTTTRDGSGSAAGAAPARYRCTACGNLTRFDVVTMRRTKAFHHYSVGGELTVEDVEILEDRAEEVRCRWCGHGDAIEVLDAQPAPAQASPPAAG
jgi:DNA-directed RNA polymerase subunit RPC12/RpoP